MIWIFLIAIWIAFICIYASFSLKAAMGCLIFPIALIFYLISLFLLYVTVSEHVINSFTITMLIIFTFLSILLSAAMEWVYTLE